MSFCSSCCRRFCLPGSFGLEAGVSADQEKALEFFKEGTSRHQGCEDGVKRLSPAGSGEAKNSDK